MNALKKCMLTMFLCLIATLYGMETRTVLSPDGKVNYLQLENKNWRLSFNPFGGRMMSVYYKPTETELTNPMSVGSFTENVWNIPPSRFFLRMRPFQYQTGNKDGRFFLACEANHPGGGIDFLKVHKTFSISENDRILRIDYAFENMKSAMARRSYAMLIHTNLAISEEQCTNYYPNEDGIHAILPEKRPLDLWLHRPARGWLAAVAPSGKGVAITMPENEVYTFYSWFSTDKVPTFEWRMIPFGVEAGESYRTRVEVIPFNGLKKVSGAGSGLVGEIAYGEVPPEPGETVPLEIKVYSGCSGKVSAELFAKRPKEAEWKSLKKVSLDFPESGQLLSFQAGVSQKAPGLLELEVVLTKDAVEAARLNAALDFGETGEKWTISPLVRKMESAAQSVDLTGFNNVRSMEHIPWAKPLPGGKLNVLALVDHENIPEIQRLSLELDMKQQTTFLTRNYYSRKFANPAYWSGNYFGILSTNDIENNLDKVVRNKYDVILIGGFPWDIFPRGIRDRILEQVRAGTGLVYIGPDRAFDFLPLRNLSGTTEAVPKAVTKIFSGIPFDLLGQEKVYRCHAIGGKVHARASGIPYLVESKLGKGRILTLNYRASYGRFGTSSGITPNLQNFYPDHASVHEFYYSLIAKTLLYAAARTLSVTFDDVKIGKGKATFSLESTMKGEAQWEIFIMNRFQKRKYSTVQHTHLKPGKQVFSFPVSVTPFSGKQSLSVILRNAKGEVLNWGSWSFENKPEASILSLTTDKPSYSEGGEVQFQLDLEGTTNGRQVNVQLIDSFDRVIAETNLAALKKLTGSLKIENELPARSYRIIATLRENGKSIDRLQTTLLVRPAPEKLAWNDYEPGIWITSDGVRPYLWKEQAEVLREINVKTIISNWGNLALRFPVQYNFHPTMLHSSGLSRAGEPKEYTKTGNKMKLIRKPCLSDPAFLKKTVKSFYETGKKLYPYALRFVWLGDEQSITSYGGLPVDFCFSSHCLAEFRTFLKERYGTLEQLNQIWETTFSSWDEVLPVTRQEVWATNGRHVAGWADHLEFMDSRLENIVRISRDAIQKADPESCISISGTQSPTAYGGMDWWRQMKVFDSLMNYFDGGQHEIQRSFRLNGRFTPWRWGYGYKGGSAVNMLWETLFLGFRGVMGFSYHSQIQPDWSLSQGMIDTVQHLRTLTSGAGKYILNSFRSTPETAILYSQASIRAAFIENRREEHRLLREKYISLLRNMGCEFDFISYEQLERGILDSGRFKNLILPDASALSEKETAAILRFAENGGTVIAEGIPATREQNCRLRTEPALGKLFQNAGHLLIPNPNTAYLEALKNPETQKNLNILEAEQKRLERALTKPSSNMKNKLVITDSFTGKAIRHASHYIRKDVFGNLFFGLLSADNRERQVKISFPVRGHIYNLVDGRYYGKTDSLELPLGLGIPYAFIVLAEKTNAGTCKVSNGCLKVSGVYPRNGVVRIRFLNPYGKEIRCFRKNILLQNGKAEMKLPFALSEPKGQWKITSTEVIGGLECTTHYYRR